MRRAFKRREKQIKAGARLEPAASCQHSRLRSCWWKLSVPCLGCLKKKKNTASLPCYSASAFLPAPQAGGGTRLPNAGLRLQQCQGCRACPALSHVCVHTPVRPRAPRSGSSEPERTCQQRCGRRGSPLRGDARALATVARSFPPMREEEVGGLGMEEKGRVEGCNAWLEKFRGVQRRAR